MIFSRLRIGASKSCSKLFSSSVQQSQVSPITNGSNLPSTLPTSDALDPTNMKKTDLVNELKSRGLTKLSRLNKKLKKELEPSPMAKLWQTLLDNKVETFDDKLVTVVKLPDGIQWLTEMSSLLFVRKCDRDLFEIGRKLARDGNPEKGIIITGNPGIGKSWFLSYWLLNLAREKKGAFFESVARNKAWLFASDGTVKEWVNPQSINFPRMIEEDANSFYLFDPAGENPREPRQVSAFTVVTASPNPHHYKQFNKRIGEEKYYMPCWTREEISSIIKYFPNLNNTTVMERFDKYGGIPRYVLSDKDKWNRSLNGAIAKAKLDTLQDSLGEPELLPAVSHKILQYEVDPSSGYFDLKVRFASEYIATKVTQKLVNSQQRKTVEFLLHTANVPSIASVRGSLFEEYAHNVLQKKGTWTIRSLTKSETQEIKYDDNLELIVFDSLDKLDLIDGVYYRPKHKNFGALDSIVRKGDNFYFFQITVSDTHPINNALLEQHIEVLTSKIKERKQFQFNLVFVLPPNGFQSFTKQPYHSTDKKVIEVTNLKLSVRAVEQWALEIPLAM